MDQVNCVPSSFGSRKLRIDPKLVIWIELRIEPTTYLLESWGITKPAKHSLDSKKE